MADSQKGLQNERQAICSPFLGKESGPAKFLQRKKDYKTSAEPFVVPF